MDGYYQAQVSMPYFKGAARQRGRGLGTLALAVGRTAYPIFKKFVLPTAKRLGKAALESAAPELLELASGRSKPKASLKRIYNDGKVIKDGDNITNYRYNNSLADIITKIPSLKYKFLGYYPANQYPNLVQNSF